MVVMVYQRNIRDYINMTIDKYKKNQKNEFIIVIS